MNKNILYIGIAVTIGLLVGWLIFSNTEEATTVSKDHDHTGETAQQMWTCSMHPQIMQPEPGDCPICGMDLIPAETSANGLAVNEIKMTNNAMALANIQTTKVGASMSSEEGDMLSLSGKIATNDENNSVQASYFDGRIERLHVNFEGQEVTRGQMLATIYAPSLVAAQQELITAASLKASQPALYNAVRNKLKLWKLSENQINTIEQSGKVRENFPVYATVSGTVSVVMAAEGDYVKQGQPIVKLSNLNSVWAEFDAYENQIASLKKGQKIEIETNAYPNKIFEGIISFIDPILNNATRTVTVRATLSNKDGLFKPGMFVQGKIKNNTTSATTSLIVPASAVMWTGERSIVYVKSNPNEPVFEMREVTIGDRLGENYNVISGLNNGDEIVTNGTFTVDAAAQLQGKRSMMNQNKVKNETTDKPIPMKMSFSKSFEKAFKEILPSYLQLKDAFIASEAKEIAISAKRTEEKLKKIDTKDLGNMEKLHVSKSINMLEAISNNHTLDNQREHFVILNENLIAIVINLNNLDKELYVQKCPMANNNKGAMWLSGDLSIKNPYYGEAMLTCGSVIDTIK